MATKADLIAEIVSKSWNGWYQINQQAASPGQDGKILTPYTIKYARFVAGVMTRPTLILYVYDEGEAGEDAVWDQDPKRKDTARSHLESYVDGLDGVVRFTVIEVNEEESYGRAEVLTTKDIAGADLPAEQIRRTTLVVWTDAGIGAIQHRELLD